MSQKYLIRIAELESQLRQKDQQLSLVEETEAFLRSALARAAKWHLNRSQFGIRIDHDLASISDHSLASQSITIWHASDH